MIKITIFDTYIKMSNYVRNCQCLANSVFASLAVTVSVCKKSELEFPPTTNNYSITTYDLKLIFISRDN